MPRFDRTRPSGGTTSLRSVKQVLGCKVGPSGASDFRLATPLPERIVTELALPDQGGGSESLGLRSPWVGLAKQTCCFPRRFPWLFLERAHNPRWASQSSRAADPHEVDFPTFPGVGLDAGGPIADLPGRMARRRRNVRRRAKLVQSAPK
jgi:hypothetical protein